MLVLSRRAGEEIVIDGNITVRVTAVKGGRVLLGITAPGSVPVHRLERAAQPAIHGHGADGEPANKSPTPAAA